jgi:hypothetical protein
MYLGDYLGAVNPLTAIKEKAFQGGNRWIATSIADESSLRWGYTDAAPTLVGESQIPEPTFALFQGGSTTDEAYAGLARSVGYTGPIAGEPIVAQGGEEAGHVVGYGVSPFVAWAKARGLRQQLAVKKGAWVYRYVDASGKRVGNLLILPPPNDAMFHPAILGAALFGIGAAWAAAGGAAGAAGGGAAASVPAGGAAAGSGAGSFGTALTTAGEAIGAGVAPIAAAAPTIASAAPALALVPAAAAAGGGGSTAALIGSTVVKAAPAVIGALAQVAKTTAETKAAEKQAQAVQEQAKAIEAITKAEAAAPSSSVFGPASSGFVPTSTTYFEPQRQQAAAVPARSALPSWAIPAAIGAAALLALPLLLNRKGPRHAR